MDGWDRGAAYGRLGERGLSTAREMPRYRLRPRPFV
jgi:hypothetical protein